MEKVDRTGTFLAEIVDHGVNKTKPKSSAAGDKIHDGLPQWVCDFRLVKYYDEDTKEWIDWSACSCGITGYFYLFGANKKATLNVELIRKAIKWQGKTLCSLSVMELVGQQVQIRIEENEWDGKTTLQVNWIDASDADPVRQLRKLDTSGVKDLDKEYAAALAGTTIETKKPVKVGGGKKSTTPPATKAGTKTKPPALPKIPATTPAEDTSPESTGLPPEWKSECTMEEAWNDLMSIVTDKGPQDAAGEMWVEEIQKRGDDESTLTNKDWAEIRNAIHSKYGVPF